MTPETKALLKFINLIAKVLPPLATLTEHATKYLLESAPTSNEIVAKNISNEKVEEAVNLEDEKVHHVDTTAKEKNTSPDSLALSLKQIEQDFSDERTRRESKLKRIQAQESSVFKFYLLFTLCALLLILWGAYEAFLTGINLIAIVSEFVGLIVGSASFLLKKWHNSLKSEERNQEKLQAEQTKYLRAIQTVLALKGKEREQQLVETAKWLRESSLT
ncbi:MAG: hypothetical protein methR_P3023 [Methyloprofundus sp.]|nr:MAG: hypothetical protein methR_P3023 [Methyloprofundus sp.]